MWDNSLTVKESEKAMINTIDVIEELGIRTHSWVQAVHDAKELSSKSSASMISKITGVDEHSLKGEVADYTFWYAIQIAIKSARTLDVMIEGNELFGQAKNSADNHLERLYYGDLQYVRAVADDTEELIDDDGETVVRKKQKKGAKLEGSIALYNEHRKTKTRTEMIELFISELEMTKSGATTYFHQRKKDFGPCVAEEKKVRTKKAGETKSERAIKLYGDNLNLNRSEMIALFISTLDTTKPGANTYFHLGKKVHGPCNAEEAGEKKVSKKVLAAELFAKNASLSKDEMIALFMTELNTSKAGATTYYYGAR